MSRNEIVDLSGKLDVSKIKPYGDYILLEILERNRSAGGLIIPGKEKTECLYGRVIAIGPGEYSPRTGEVYPIGVKPGDIVMSVQYMGEKIQAIGKQYRLIREHGIWAKLSIETRGEHDWEIIDLEPYRDRILLKMDAEEKSLKGHVYLPSNPQAMFRLATLVKSGPGSRNKKTGVVSPVNMISGERLIVMRYAGCVVRINGVEHRVASSDDVEGVITKDTVVDVIADPNKHPQPVDNYDVIPDEQFTEWNKKTIMDSGGKL